MSQQLLNGTKVNLLHHLQRFLLEIGSPCAKESIPALQERMPNPTLVVLERQEHNAMEAGREVLANACLGTGRHNATIVGRRRFTAPA
jgi:hypothetical protein